MTIGLALTLLVGANAFVVVSDMSLAQQRTPMLPLFLGRWVATGQRNYTCFEVVTEYDENNEPYECWREKVVIRQIWSCELSGSECYLQSYKETPAGYPCQGYLELPPNGIPPCEGY